MNLPSSLVPVLHQASVSDLSIWYISRLQRIRNILRRILLLFWHIILLLEKLLLILISSRIWLIFVASLVVLSIGQIILIQLILALCPRMTCRGGLTLINCHLLSFLMLLLIVLLIHISIRNLMGSCLISHTSAVISLSLRSWLIGWLLLLLLSIFRLVLVSNILIISLILRLGLLGITLVCLLLVYMRIRLIQ